jgi:hypothetical protein
VRAMSCQGAGYFRLNWFQNRYIYWNISLFIVVVEVGRIGFRGYDKAAKSPSIPLCQRGKMTACKRDSPICGPPF